MKNLCVGFSHRLRGSRGLHVVLVMSSQLAPDYLLINRNYGNIVLALTNPIQKSDQISSFISPPGGEKSNLNVKPRPRDKVTPLRYLSPQLWTWRKSELTLGRQFFLSEINGNV